MDQNIDGQQTGEEKSMNSADLPRKYYLWLSQVYENGEKIYGIRTFYAGLSGRGT